MRTRTETLPSRETIHRKLNVGLIRETNYISRCLLFCLSSHRLISKCHVQWGQGLQLIEDNEKADGAGGGPVPFRVEAGEVLDLVVRFSADSVCLQFNLERVKAEET